MKTYSFTLGLRKKFSAEEWPWLAAALHQDPGVWTALTTTDLGQNALAELPAQPEKWTVAALACLALGIKTAPDPAHAAPVLQQAQHALSEWLKSEDTLPASLPQAGLAALALQEQFTKEPALQPLLSQFRIQPDFSGLVLACLASLLPEPEMLVRHLLQSSSKPEVIRCALHVSLCQPQPLAQQAAGLVQLLENMSSEAKIQILRELAVMRPALCEIVAPQLLEPAPQGFSLLPADQASQLGQLQAQIQAQQLLKQNGETARSLNQAILLSRRLQADLSAQLAKILSHKPGRDLSRVLPAWKNAAAMAPECGLYAANLALAMIDAGLVEDATAYLATKISETGPAADPVLLIAQALVYSRSGQREAARQPAQTALAALHKGHTLELGDLWHPYAQLLFDLGLVNECILATRHGLKALPDQPALLALQARCWLHCGETQQSINAANLGLASVLLKPAAAEEHGVSEADMRRLYIHALEQAEEWPLALDEWRALLAKNSDAPASMLHQMAYAAMKAGEYETASSACQKILEFDAQDGLAYGLLGHIALQQGKLEAAEEHLVRSSQMNPDQAQCWVDLAQLQRLRGEPESAIQTLRIGAQAASRHAEIHLALGEMLLEEGAHASAQPVLRRAYLQLRQKPEGTGMLVQRANVRSYQSLEMQTALRLGQALFRLARYEEARRILEIADERPAGAGTWTTELKYLFAQTLAALEEWEKAIPLYEFVHQEVKDAPAVQVDLADALLHSADQPSGARQSLAILLNVLEQREKTLPLAKTTNGPAQLGSWLVQNERPLNLEAQAFLGDAYNLLGEHQNALVSFRKALETPLASQPTWRGRLVLGLGKSSLELGEAETAIAALQEAVQCQPNHLETYRLLSQAYQAAGLELNSLQTARAAIDQAPTNLELLEWYGKQLLASWKPNSNELAQLGKEAVGLLEQGLQIAPQRSDLLIMTGQLQLLLGQNDAAIGTFQRVQRSVHLPGERRHHPCADLYQAAQSLRASGEMALGVELLNQAIELASSSSYESGESDCVHLGDLLLEMANTQYELGKLDQALLALEHAIQTSPDEWALQEQRVHWFVKAGRLAEALQEIERISQLKPSFELVILGVQLALRLSRPHAALEAARQAARLALALPSKINYIGAFYLSAELENLLLQSHSGKGSAGDENLAAVLFNLSEKVRQGLAEDPDLQFDAAFGLTTKELIFHSACLIAEKALERQENGLADLAQTIAANLDGEHTRLLALQVRAGATRLHKALPVDAQAQLAACTRPEVTSAAEARLLAKAATLRSTGLAFLLGRQWDQALDYFEASLKLLPHQPAAWTNLAQTLVCRAEAARLHAALLSIRHGPDASALAEAAQTRWHNALEKARFWSNPAPDGRAAAGEQPQPDGITRPGEIDIWDRRGQAVFSPSLAAAQALEQVARQPQDTCAVILAYLDQNERSAPVKAGQPFNRDLPVMLHLAITLGRFNPRQAYGALSAVLASPAAIERANKSDLNLANACLAQLAAQAGMNGRDRQRAIKAIADALANWPDEPRWQALAAELYLNQSSNLSEDTHKAVAHLEKAIQLEPGHAPHYRVLSACYQSQQKLAAAIRTLETGNKLDASHPAEWLRLARLQYQAGELEAAAASAEQALEIVPSIEALALRGEIALQTQNPRGALSRAQAILRLDAQDAQGLRLLALSLEALNRIEEALQTVEKALEQAQDKLPFEHLRARLLEPAHGTAKAITSLQNLCMQYSQDPVFPCYLAHALLHSEQIEAAQELAATALRKDNGQLSPDEQAGLHYLLGSQLRQQGQLDNAIHHYSEAIKFAPAKIDFYLELGQVYEQRRQQEQALNVYEQAASRDPADFRPYYHAGLALKESKDYLQAETMLRRAVELAPNEVSIHRVLGAVVALNLVHNRR